MNGRNHPMDFVYRVLKNSPELTDKDLLMLMKKEGRAWEEENGELRELYEKLDVEQKESVLVFMKNCLMEKERNTIG